MHSLWLISSIQAFIKLNMVKFNFFLFNYFWLFFEFRNGFAEINPSLFRDRYLFSNLLYQLNV